MTDKPSYYSILTADVRYDEKLSASEKLLFSEITALANKYGYCTASNGYLADLYGVKKTTVSHWLIHLKEKNYISIEIERNDKKEIISRKIYPISTPIAQKNNRYSKNEQDPIAQKSKENITSINNINSEVDKESKRDRFDYDKFISWFNEITGRNFSSKALFKKYINARLNEGFTKEDIAKVVTFKAGKWKDTEMKEYLRPNTLFALSHFDNYLQEAKEGLPEPQKKKEESSAKEEKRKVDPIDEQIHRGKLFLEKFPDNEKVRKEIERLERNRNENRGDTAQ